MVGNHSSLLRLQIFSFCTVWVTYCVTYFLRKPVGIVKQEIGTIMSLDKTQLGWMDTALLLPYSLVQIALSPLWDKTIPRVVIAVCLSASSVAMLLFSGAPNFAFLLLALFVSGAAQAPIWPACTKILSAWYPEDRLGSVFGTIHSAPYAGALIGTGIAIYLQGHFNWRVVFVPSAAAGLLISLFVLYWLRTPDEVGMEVPGQVASKTKSTTKTTTSFLDLLAVPAVKELAAAAFCLKFVRYCMYMWLPLYFVEHLGYSKTLGGVFSLAFDVGGIVGSPAVGFFIDRKFGQHPILGVGIVSVMGSVSFFLMSLIATWGPAYVAVLLVVAGAANCGPDSLVTGSLSMSVGEKLGRGSGAGVTSVVNGIGSAGAILEGPVVGALSQWVGWSGVVHAMVVLSLGASAATIMAHMTASRASIASPSHNGTSPEKAALIT